MNKVEPIEENPHYISMRERIHKSRANRKALELCRDLLKHLAHNDVFTQDEFVKLELMILDYALVAELMSIE